MRRLVLFLLAATASVALATPFLIIREDGTTEVHGGGPSVPPMLEHQVAPVVPDSLLPALQDTAILLFVTINEVGLVDSVQYLTGERLLYEPAASAVRQWRYSPALHGTLGVEVRIPLPLAFSPSQGDSLLEWSSAAMRRFEKEAR